MGARALAHLGFAVQLVLEELDLLDRPELRGQRLELNVRGPPDAAVSLAAKARNTSQHAPSQARDVHRLGRPGWFWRRRARGCTRRPQEVAARTRQDDAARTSSACVAHAVPRQVVRAVQPALLARERTRLLRVGFRRETRARAPASARHAPYRCRALRKTHVLARPRPRLHVARASEPQPGRAAAGTGGVPSSSFWNRASSSPSASHSATPAAVRAPGQRRASVARRSPHTHLRKTSKRSGQAAGEELRRCLRRLEHDRHS